MKRINIKKLLKEKTPKEIISDYMEGKINLTQSQLQSVINRKNGKDYGRGSAMIGGKNG